MRTPVISAVVIIAILALITIGVFFMVWGPLYAAKQPVLNGPENVPSVNTTVVILKNGYFTPSNISVVQGTNVSWVSQEPSGMIDTVTSDTSANGTMLFDSGVLRGGNVFSYNFTNPGVYKYHSAVNYYARGIVLVSYPNGTVPGLQGSNQGNATSPGGNVTKIDIKNFAFNPSNITISKGTTITWTNNDNVDHTATSESGPTSFDSGNIKPGASWSYTFTESGTYNYICTIHPFMKATITVT